MYSKGKDIKEDNFLAELGHCSCFGIVHSADLLTKTSTHALKQQYFYHTTLRSDIQKDSQALLEILAILIHVDGH